MSLFDNCSKISGSNEVKTIILLKYGPVVMTEEYLNTLPLSVIHRAYEMMYGKSPFRCAKDNLQEQLFALCRFNSKSTVLTALEEYHTLHL